MSIMELAMDSGMEIPCIESLPDDGSMYDNQKSSYQHGGWRHVLLCDLMAM